MKRGSWTAEKQGTSGVMLVGRGVNKGASTAKPNPTLSSGVGESNSNYYLQTRSNEENVSPKLLNQVTAIRQEQLVAGEGRTSYGFNLPGPRISNSLSYRSNPNITKTADANAAGGYSTLGQTGASGTRLGPEIYSPLFQIANLQLPRDRITMNAWNRNFYDTHPLVHNCINLHSTYPISKINIKCKDSKVEKFFHNMCEEIDIHSVLLNVALDYFKLGETFPYAELDESRGVWKSIRCLNPDYIQVKQAVVGGEPLISMRPDAALMRLVQSSNPADVQLKSQIPEEMLYHIKKGNNIPLDNFHVSHLKMLSSPYDLHGTSMIVSIYKDLMHYDKLREAKFAQADGFVNPITLVKVGGANDGDYRATEADLEKWRNTFEAAQYDKDFKIISHAGVTVERIGAAGQVIDISPDIAMIMDNILYGLMTPKSVLTTEGSSSYAQGSIGLEVLKQRYEGFRNMMAQWLIKKVFAPISEIQGFYEYDNQVKRLIVPEIEWNTMILLDMTDYIATLKDLAEKNTVSQETLFKSLGLNIEQEQRRLKQQKIDAIVAEKEAAILKNMTIATLKSLDVDSDIVEPADAEAMPGTTSESSTDGGLSDIPGVGGLEPGATPDTTTPPPPEASAAPAESSSPAAAPGT